MKAFGSFYGVIISIEDLPAEQGMPSGCTKMMTIQDEEDMIVNFIVTPSTYFVDHEAMEEGYEAVGFYDFNAPVPLIYPPQYRAIVMARLVPGQNVKTDYFSRQLVSSDGTLKLNIAPTTEIYLENGQIFNGPVVNRNLTVIYGPTTRSIPAQTTPYSIIVMCPRS